MSLTNKQIVLASRPQAEPSVDNFRLVESAVPELAKARCWCATSSSVSTRICACA